MLSLLLLLLLEHASACADDDAGLRVGVQANFPQYAAIVNNCAALPTYGLCTNAQSKAVAEQYCPVTCNVCPPSGAAPSPSASSAASPFWCSSQPGSGVHIVQTSTSSVDNSCTLTNFVTVTTSLELSSDKPGTQAVISGTRTLLYGLLPIGKRLFKLEINSNLTLTDLIIEKGTGFSSLIQSGGKGGGIYAAASSCIRMTRTVVRDCQAPRGGALYMEKETKLILEDAVFESNTAVNLGGAIFMKAATMNIVVGSSATFANNMVIGVPEIPSMCNFELTCQSLYPVNTGSYAGGALFMSQASSIKVTGAGTKLIVDSNAAGNFLGKKDAGMGGGLYVAQESTVSVDMGAQLNCTGNQAMGFGGCMALKDPGTRLDVNDATSSLIVSKNEVHLPLNSAGGGIYLRNSAVMYVTAPSRFVENKAKYGGGGRLLLAPIQVAASR